MAYGMAISARAAEAGDMETMIHIARECDGMNAGDTFCGVDEFEPQVAASPGIPLAEALNQLAMMPEIACIVCVGRAKKGELEPDGSHDRPWPTEYADVQPGEFRIREDGQVAMRGFPHPGQSRKAR